MNHVHYRENVALLKKQKNNDFCKICTYKKHKYID